MRRACATAFLVVALLASGTTPLFAFSNSVMSPAEVIAIDRDRDGTRVTVEGEAVGESLRAVGGGRWVNILGDEVGLGIWMTDEMAEKIEHFGDYRYDGDIVRVTGIVNVACEEHGGEFDVHATEVMVVDRGQPRDTPVRPWRGVVGFVGICVALVLAQVYRGRRERRMV